VLSCSILHKALGLQVASSYGIVHESESGRKKKNSKTRNLCTLFSSLLLLPVFYLFPPLSQRGYGGGGDSRCGCVLFLYHYLLLYTGFCRMWRDGRLPLYLNGVAELFASAGWRACCGTNYRRERKWDGMPRRLGWATKTAFCVVAWHGAARHLSISGSRHESLLPMKQRRGGRMFLWWKDERWNWNGAAWRCLTTPPA